jgi:hypothetical protein
MTWTDLPRDPTPRALRQFGAAWLAVFLALGLYRWLAREQEGLGLVLCLVAVAGGLPGLARPALIRWLFIGAMVVTFPIGWVLSQAMLALMFYVIITPVAVFFRLRGRDLLNRKPAPGRPSFWLPKQQPRDMRRYFRQY